METWLRHAEEMLVQSLEAQVAQATKEQTQWLGPSIRICFLVSLRKGQFKAKRLQAKATAGGDLEETKAQKASDEKYLADLKATCKKKAVGFEERQKLRGEELEAIGKAQEVLEGDAVAGNAETFGRNVSFFFFMVFHGFGRHFEAFLGRRAQEAPAELAAADLLGLPAI